MSVGDNFGVEELKNPSDSCGHYVWHLDERPTKQQYDKYFWKAILRVVTVVGFTAGRDAQLNSFGSVFSATVHM
eukprot:g78364.t1